MGIFCLLKIFFNIGVCVFANFLIYLSIFYQELLSFICRAGPVRETRHLRLKRQSPGHREVTI